MTLTLSLLVLVLVLGGIVAKQSLALRHLRRRHDLLFRNVEELLERDWNRLTHEEKAAAIESAKTFPQRWMAEFGPPLQQIDPEKALKKFR